MKLFIMLFKNYDLNSVLKNVRPNLCKLVVAFLNSFITMSAQLFVCHNRNVLFFISTAGSKID